MKPHTELQHKIARVEKESYYRRFLINISELRYLELYSLHYSFTHRYNSFGPPPEASMLHATPIIPELCPLLLSPYDAGKKKAYQVVRRPNVRIHCRLSTVTEE